MTRTQVQLPDDIYLRAKRLAEAKEISLAELTRRGLELILAQYPAPEKLSRPWKMPLVRGLGWKGLSDEEIKTIAQMSAVEEELEEQARVDARL